jgi:hypothetical protein
MNARLLLSNDEMCSGYTQLLFHTEVRFLSRRKVLNCLLSCDKNFNFLWIKPPT